MNNSRAVAVRQSEISLPFSPDPLSEAIRQQIRGAIARIAQEELAAFLGAESYERSSRRRGYRNGAKTRTLATSFGKTEFLMPRAVVFEGGRHTEWQSSIVPRYARRAREVDAALLGLYFGGINQRKVGQAIRPLLRDSPMSRAAVSRLVVGLKEYFDGWRTRSLAEEDITYVYLDGTYVRVRCAGRSGSLPVMAVVGVRATGEKVLLALELRGSESEAAWESCLQSLVSRGLKRPQLAIIDGNPGLVHALDELWPSLPRQRCVVHKLRNLKAHAPKRLHDEIDADFHAIVYAEDAASVRVAYDAFLRKWRRLSEGVARSFEEAGEDLITFIRFPKSQWKAIRRTNIIERLNQEFRRRIKTQGCFPTESSVLILLFGLVASGMVRMKRIGGYEDITTTQPVQSLVAA
jgi:transposase-like protein